MYGMNGDAAAAHAAPEVDSAVRLAHVPGRGYGALQSIGVMVSESGVSEREITNVNRGLVDGMTHPPLIRWPRRTNQEISTAD